MKGSFFFYNHKSCSTNIKQGPPPSKNQSWGWSRFSNFSLEKFLIDIYSVIIIIIIIIIINLGSTVLMIFCFLCIWVWTLQKTNTNLEKNEEKDLSNPSTSPENKHQETEFTRKLLIFPPPPPPHHDYIQFSTKTHLAKRPTSHLLFTLNLIECGGMTLLHRRWIAEGGKRMR